MKPLVPQFSGSELEGGVAVVTGAGVGLGRAEALALGAAGAKVVVNDISDAAERVAAEIVAAGGEAVGVPGDIGDWDFATSLVERAVSTYGGLNVVVNNAGVLRDRMIFSISADEWDTVIRVHLRGHAATCKAATAYWLERNKATGEPQWARVVNTASEAFLFGSPGQPNYSAAKAGIAALTLSVAHGASRYGVRVSGSAQAGYDENTFYDNAIIGNLVWGDVEFGRKATIVGRKSSCRANQTACAAESGLASSLCRPARSVHERTIAARSSGDPSRTTIRKCANAEHQSTESASRSTSSGGMWRAIGERVSPKRLS